MAKAPVPPDPTPAAAPKKSCFIIMPITTPDHYSGLCAGDKDHFQHILDCLFIPALTAAGFEPTPPEARGADIIHAHIVESLNTADLVFCDMSSLNANVFFEFGIRTALNKPICLVKDELTPKVPFDTGIINHHTYSSKMAAWELEDEKAKLTRHVKASYERNGNGNALWKYFGLKVSSKFEAGESTVEKKLDLLSMEVAALRDPVPSGLAQELYIALSELQYDGSVTTRGQEVTAKGTLGQVVNILNGRPEWATMRAIVQAVTEDIDNGTKSITIGASRFLSMNDMIQLLTVNRVRQRWTSSESPTTGNAPGSKVRLPAKAAGIDAVKLQQSNQRSVYSEGPLGVGPPEPRAYIDVDGRGRKAITLKCTTDVQEFDAPYVWGNGNLIPAGSEIDLRLFDCAGKKVKVQNFTHIGSIGYNPTLKTITIHYKRVKVVCQSQDEGEDAGSLTIPLNP